LYPNVILGHSACQSILRPTIIRRYECKLQRILSSMEIIVVNLIRLTKFVVMVLFSCLLLVRPAICSNIEWLPMVTIGAGYNDNITFDYTETVEDYYASARPSLLAAYDKELFKLNVDSSIEFYRYANEKDLDNEVYDCGIDGDYRLSERATISGDISYLNDTTIDSELEETGRLLAREMRERFVSSAKLSYKLGELSEFSLGYQYRQTDYESASRVDRNTHTFQIPYSRYFNNRIDRITVRPLYSKTDTDGDRIIDNYDLSLGWIHTFSDSLSAKYFAGYDYSVTTGGGERNRRGNGNADISVTKAGEIVSLTAGFRSATRIDAQGELIEVDRLYASLRKLLTERIAFSLNARVLGSRPLDRYNRFDTVYWDAKPQMTYQLTERCSLNIFYRYSSDHNSTISGEQDRARHIAEFRIDYRFSKFQ